MPDNLKEVAHALPFMLPAAHGALSVGGGQTVNKTRILEAVIIAAMVGLLSVGGAWFLLIPELKTEFKYIARDVQELRIESATVQTELKQLQINVARIEATRSPH